MAANLQNLPYTTSSRRPVNGKHWSDAVGATAEADGLLLPYQSPKPARKGTTTYGHSRL